MSFFIVLSVGLRRCSGLRLVIHLASFSIVLLRSFLSRSNVEHSEPINVVLNLLASLSDSKACARSMDLSSSSPVMMF